MCKQLRPDSEESEGVCKRQRELEDEVRNIRADLRQQKNILADYSSANIKDARTVPGFLRGERKKPGKLAVMREYFLTRLKAGTFWLRPWIESFFTQPELKKSSRRRTRQK